MYPADHQMYCPRVFSSILTYWYYHWYESMNKYLPIYCRLYCKNISMRLCICTLLKSIDSFHINLCSKPHRLQQPNHKILRTLMKYYSSFWFFLAQAVLKLLNLSPEATQSLSWSYSISLLKLLTVCWSYSPSLAATHSPLLKILSLSWSYSPSLAATQSLSWSYSLCLVFLLVDQFVGFTCFWPQDVCIRTQIYQLFVSCCTSVWKLWLYQRLLNRRLPVPVVLTFVFDIQSSTNPQPFIVLPDYCDCRLPTASAPRPQLGSISGPCGFRSAASVSPQQSDMDCPEIERRP